MNKRKIQESFSDIRASELLVGEVLNKKKTKRSYRSALVAASIAVACLISGFLMGAGFFRDEVDTPEGVMTAHVDWNMHAAWINADGEVQETLKFFYEAKFYTSGENSMQLDQDFTFPESFRYRVSDPSNGKNTVFGEALHGYPYCIWCDFSYDCVTNDIVWSHYALSLEQEWMIMWWDNEDDLYLVASRDPEADPKEVLAYFQGYIDMCHE